MSDQAAARNSTYRQLRAPARQGSYTVGQLVGLAAAGLLAVGIAAGLLRIGAPVGLALMAGVLIAGSIPMAALALEGREFSIPGLIGAVVAWRRSPREFAATAEARRASYYVSDRPIEARVSMRKGRR